MSVVLFRPRRTVTPPPTPPTLPRQTVTPVVEVAFANPGSSPTWVDITAYTRGFQTRRGRSTELDRTNAGTCTLRLDNRDRRFDPAYAASPYYPYVVPARRVRIAAEVDSGLTAFSMRSSGLRDGSGVRAGIKTMPVFAGFVESWQPSYTATSQMIVDVQAVDGFKVLALQDFDWGHRTDSGGNFIAGQDTGNAVPDVGPPLVPDDYSGVRIGRVLDAIGWPSGDRDIDTGDWQVLGSDSVFGGSTNIKVAGVALEHALAVADIEGGVFYMDGLGRVRFRSESNVPAISSGVWGDGTGENPVQGIAVDYDDTRLWNDITVTSTSAVMASTSVEDATSIAAYYRRSYSTSVLPAWKNPDQSPHYRADRLLARYKDPKLRITSLQPLGIDAGWIDILSRELFEVITVRIRPLGGTLIEQVSRIEGISIDHQGANRWRVTWDLSAI